MRWYGFIIWLCGAYPVYTKLRSFGSSLDKTVKILQNKQDILMFPVGKIRSSFDFNHARPGIAYLAKELDPLIVPVRISGTYKINFWEFITGKRKVVIKYGKPFRCKEKNYNEKYFKEVASKIASAIETV